MRPKPRAIDAEAFFRQLGAGLGVPNTEIERCLRKRERGRPKQDRHVEMICIWANVEAARRAWGWQIVRTCAWLSAPPNGWARRATRKERANGLTMQYRSGSAVRALYNDAVALMQRDAKLWNMAESLATILAQQWRGPRPDTIDGYGPLLLVNAEGAAAT